MPGSAQPRLPADRGELEIVQQLVQRMAAGHEKIGIGERKGRRQRFQPPQLGGQRFLQREMILPVPEGSTHPVQGGYLLMGRQRRVANRFSLGEHGLQR